MSSVFEIIGYQYSFSNSKFYQKTKTLTKATMPDAKRIAQEMANRSNSDLNAAPKREISRNQRLKPKLGKSADHTLICIDLSAIDIGFLDSNPIDQISYFVLGQNKQFVSVVHSTSDYVIFAVDTKAIRAESKKLDQQHQHIIAFLPLFLNFVYKPYKTSMPIIHHLRSKTKAGEGNEDLAFEGDTALGVEINSHGGFHPPNDSAESGAQILTHGGFHPPNVDLDL